MATKDITYCTNINCPRFSECKRSEWVGQEGEMSFAGFDCEKYEWDNYLPKDNKNK